MSKTDQVLITYSVLPLTALNLSNFLSSVFNASQLDSAKNIGAGHALSSLYVSGQRLQHTSDKIAEYRARVESEHLLFSFRLEAAYALMDELSQNEYAYLLAQPLTALSIGEFVQIFPDFVTRHIPVQI